MAPRNWTIVLVPPDNGRSKTIHIGQRERRAILGAVGATGLLLTSALVFLFLPYATPGGRLLASENERLRERLTQIDDRLIALNDTLSAVAAQGDQLRALTGGGPDSGEVAMAVPANAESAGGTTLASIVPEAHLPKPLADRLGFGRKPDVEGIIRRASEMAASFRAVSDTLTRNFERLAHTPSIMPTSGWLSSHFTESRNHPVLHFNRPHEGIDVAAPMGAPIVAPAGGRVKSVGFEAGYGNTFEIDHGNGIVTRFAHCSRIVVRAGQTVTVGQVVATVGSTGLTTGPHLHYEVHVNGRPVDPLKFVVDGKATD